MAPDLLSFWEVAAFYGSFVFVNSRCCLNVIPCGQLSKVFFSSRSPDLGEFPFIAFKLNCGVDILSLNPPLSLLADDYFLISYNNLLKINSKDTDSESFLLEVSNGGMTADMSMILTLNVEQTEPVKIQSQD